MNLSTGRIPRKSFLRVSPTFKSKKMQKHYPIYYQTSSSTSGFPRNALVPLVDSDRPVLFENTSHRNRHCQDDIPGHPNPGCHPRLENIEHKVTCADCSKVAQAGRKTDHNPRHVLKSRRWNRDEINRRFRARYVKRSLKYKRRHQHKGEM
jgi:hypothetical protein